jgi:hypothetical protein
VLIGMLSDRHGLAAALTAVPVVCCAAGLLFVAAARTYARDRKRVDGLQPAASL